MEGRLFQPTGAAVRAMSRCDVGLVPQHRVDLGLAAGLIEFECPVQIPMIGDGTRIHPQRLDAIDKVGNTIRPVEQAVMRVAMQMGKRPRLVHGCP